MISFCKKEELEFSHSPEHAFTSSAIYCLKAEIFWALPYNTMKCIGKECASEVTSA